MAKNQKRYEGKEQIRQVDLGTGLPEATMSLVQKLDQFDSQLQQFAGAGFAQRAENEEQAGAEEAEAAQLRDKEGKLKPPPFKESGLFDRHRTRAYNATISAAYQASLSNDNREKLSELYITNKYNPLGFNDKANAYYNGVVSNVDPYIRAEVAQDLERSMSAYRVQIRANQYDKARADTRTDISLALKGHVEEAAAKTKNGDNKGAALNLWEAGKQIKSLVDNGFKTEAEGQQLKKDVVRATQDQFWFKTTRDTYETQGLDAAIQELGELSKEVPPEYTADQWRSTLIQAQQDIFRYRRGDLKAEKEAKKLEDLNLSIARGEVSFRQGILIDPAKGSQGRKDMNAFFDHVKMPEWLGQLKEGAAEGNKEAATKKFTDNITGFIEKVGVIPDRIISTVNTNMRNGSTLNAVASAALVEGLVRDPNFRPVLKDLPDDARKMAKDIVDLMDGGLNEEQAVEQARDNILPLDAAATEAILYATEDNIDSLQADLQSLIDKDKQFDPSWMVMEPEVPPRMEADFAVNFRRFMRASRGNVEQSKELAYGSLKKYWTFTAIGSENKMMKYSPEAMYGRVGQTNHKWIKDDWDKSSAVLSKSTGLHADEFTIEIDPTQIYSKTPAYIIMDYDGHVVYDKKTGKVAKWRPEWNKTLQSQIEAQQNEKSIQRSTEIREEARTVEDEMDHLYHLFPQEAAYWEGVKEKPGLRFGKGEK